jgi:hypothetical protein
MNHYRYHLRYISWIKWDSGSGDWWNIAVLLAPSMHVFQLCHLFPKSEPVRIACISPSRSLIWNLSFPTKLLLLLFNWNKASRRQGDEALLQPRNHQTLPHYHSTTSTSTPFFLWTNITQLHDQHHFQALFFLSLWSTSKFSRSRNNYALLYFYLFLGEGISHNYYANNFFWSWNIN